MNTTRKVPATRASEPPLRFGGSVFLTPPWRRAPWLLLGIPVVFVAVAVAMAVLAVAAASGPLFLASTRTADFHVQAASSCPEASLPGLANVVGSNEDAGGFGASEPQSGAAVVRGDRAIRAALRRAGLPSPYLVQLGMQLVVQGVATAASGGVTLFSRPDALAHVKKLTPAGGSGVWVPDDVAGLHHIVPGQHLQTAGGRVRVAGIYRYLGVVGFDATVSLARYWCTWEPLIVPSLEHAPPPLFITDPGMLRRLAGRTPIQPGNIDAHWYIPEPVGSMTVPQATAMNRRADAVPAALARQGLQLYFPTDDLHQILRRADRVRNGLRGSVVPIDLGAVAVALLLVAGAGAFWTVRRARELRLLVARGIGPAALAGKAILEVTPAVLVGAVVGWFGAIGLVQALGPASQLEPGARWQSLGTVAAAVLAGLAVVAIVAVAATRDRGRRQAGWVWLIPWELVLIAAAAIVYAAIRRSGATEIVLGAVHLNPLVLAFPLLALTGCLLLLGRLARFALPLLRRVSSRAGPAGYLAVRRITGAPAVSIALAVGVALPSGILVYTSSIAGSLTANLPAKFGTYIGADHAFHTLNTAAETIDTAGHGTVVSVVNSDASIGADQPVGVLGVQPASFARFAYHGAEVAGLVDRLTPRSGQPVPALLVNAPAGTRVRTLTLGNSTVPVRVAERAALFPGLRNGYHPLLVVDRTALAHVDPFINRTEEVWTTDQQLAACTAALARHHIESLSEINPQTFLDSSGLLPVTWIDGYLRALAILTGLVALTGLVFALAARVRRQTAAYVLTRRMGWTSTRTDDRCSSNSPPCSASAGSAARGWPPPPPPSSTGSSTSTLPTRRGRRYPCRPSPSPPASPSPPRRSPSPPP